MFDGVPHDQLHQFIASSRASSLPLPLSSFPLHHSQTTLISSSFDPYQPQPHPQVQLLPLQQQHAAQHFLHPILHQQHQPHQESPSNNTSQKSCINEEKEPANNTMVSSANSLEIERERSVVLPEVPSNTDDPWSNEEVLALLRIRSTMENWFPDFTWEHISRKLSELGFKRSAEKCKQKFEEESRYFNNINNCTKSSYRFLSELEELYHSEENPPQNETNNISGAQKSHIRDEINPSEGAGEDQNDNQLGSSPQTRNDQVETFNGAKESTELEAVEDEKAVENNEDSRSKSQKRKRQKRKFEMFKGFCEEIVNKMMSQQEEMHNKILEDMVKRDKEKVEKEEAWKKQEMDRMNKELEIMAYEQAIAGDRQATIIEYLKKFTSSGTSTSSSDQSQFSAPKKGKDSLNQAVLLLAKSSPPNDPVSLTSNSSLIQAAHESPNGAPNPTSHHPHESQNNLNIVEEPPSSSSSAMILRHQNSTLSSSNVITETLERNPSAVVSKLEAVPTTQPCSKNPNQIVKNPLASPTPSTTQKVQNDNKEDVGKRWPRDEVLALINLRCSLYNSTADADKDQQQGGSVKAPLWERISQGMSDLGYKRSAKRCKEKWENINKYFRKTKDVNKKRSVDSRTCPYFHLLSTLYSRGTLVAPASEGQEIIINHDHSSQIGSQPADIDHHHHHHHDRDHHDHHHSSHVHVAKGEISDNNVVVHHPPHHHQEVPAAFDFEF